jgi:hypothetical protein
MMLIPPSKRRGRPKKGLCHMRRCCATQTTTIFARSIAHRGHLRRQSRPSLLFAPSHASWDEFSIGFKKSLRSKKKLCLGARRRAGIGSGRMRALRCLHNAVVFLYRLHPLASQPSHC